MSKKVSPSKKKGMGAIPYKKGTAFRVWAPNADKVFVTGDFNDWSPDKNPLAHEEGGYWSVNVTGAAVGDEYKYIIHNGEESFHRIDPYARAVTNSVGNGIVHDPNFDWGNDDFEMPPWHKVVIYELHIGTFNDDPGGPPGNFESAVKRFPYLQKLGINAIQVMPPMEFAGGFSWGYNPANIFAIESDYGGPNAFKEFIKAAHAHGMAVIVDVVYNHFGPSDLNLWRFDGWSENGGGGIYFYNDGRSETPWGNTRPDYGREEVRQYIRDNALMWINEYRVDGLRWDATAYIRNVHGNNHNPFSDIAEGWGLMQWINDDLDSTYPNQLSIAEDLRGNDWITKPTAEGGAGFDSQWDSEFVHPVRGALLAYRDEDRNLEAVRDAIYNRYDGDVLTRIIYTESHDEVANGKARVPEEIWPGNADSWHSKKRSTLGAALVFTSPGIPMIFQGQELLEDQWFDDQDPIDWERTEEFEGIVALYRDLIHLRRNLNGHTRGLTGHHVAVTHLNNQGKVMAFFRWADGGEGDTTAVILNFSAQPWEEYTIGLPEGGRWCVRFNSDAQRYDEDFSNFPTTDIEAHEGEYDGQPFHGTLALGPYSAVILSQDP